MTTRYWLFVGLTLILTTGISYGTYATSRLLKQWVPERNLLLNPIENAARFGIILLCLGLGLLSGLDWGQLGWQWTEASRQISVGLGLGVVLGIVFYFSTRLIMALTGQRFYSTIVIQHLIPNDNRELFLVLVAMAPVVFLEELLFRSLLLGGFAPVAPVTGLVIILSILFGLLHTPQGIWGMIGAGLAGLLFSLLFLWQQSLLAPFIAHYITNAIQIIQAKRTITPEQSW
ncbi:MAG: CPBP family intramembrane glutamic endopeptidase [Chloroflexota bacterium]